MKHLEEIESYVDGNMDADERLRFEASLDSDSELKAEFEELKAIYNGFEGLRIERDLKKRLQKLEAEIQAEETRAAKKTISNRWRPWLGAAMIAVAASIALIWMLLPGKNGIDPAFLPREMGLPVTMGTSTHRFDAAMTPFKQGKFQEASAELIAIPDAAMNDTVAYYLGICSLRLGQMVESRQYFGSIHPTSAYTMRADFYLGLLSYIAGEKAEARAKLEPIAGQDSSEYGRKARLILAR